MDQKSRQCLRCGYDLSTYEKLSYEEKLILALKHPIRENRMMAVQVLGKLHSRTAIPLFTSLLQTEEDFYMIREIVHALVRIGNVQSTDIIQKLKDHPLALVRHFMEDINTGRVP
jgi:HEAT repeat protein